MRTLVVAKSLFTGTEDYSPGALIIGGGIVEAVGPLRDLQDRGPFAEILGDASESVVVPGFVDAHEHSPRPSRPGLVDAPLELSLLQLRRRRLPPVPEQDQRQQTRWFALALLRTGVTTVVDCFSPDPSRADLGLIPSAEAYLDSGIRAALCVRCSDQRNITYQDDDVFYAGIPAQLREASIAKSKPFDADSFFGACEDVARDLDGKDGRLRIGYGPTGEQWCSDQLLRRIDRTSGKRDAPVQIHLLESPLQAVAAEQRYGHSAVQRLADAGLVGPRVSFAHSIWLSPTDLEIIRDAGSVIINNPGSNLRYGNGIAPVDAMLESGCHVGLGLDANGFEAAPDMFREMRLAMLLQRPPGWRAFKMRPRDILNIATAGGAPAAAMRVGIGTLAVGNAADVVILDGTRVWADPYATSESADAIAVNRADPRAIDRVIVGGRTVFQSGEDADREFAALTERVTAAVSSYLPLLDEADSEFNSLRPFVDEYFSSLDAASPHRRRRLPLSRS